MQLPWQLLWIDRIDQFQVERFAGFQFLLRRADNQPKHFRFGIVEYLAQLPFRPLLTRLDYTGRLLIKTE